MAKKHEEVKKDLHKSPSILLVTSTAGFIESNLAEVLLKLDQKVISLDNFTIGHRNNLEYIKDSISSAQWKNFA